MDAHAHIHTRGIGRRGLTDSDEPSIKPGLNYLGSLNTESFLVYRILGIVRRRKLSQVTFIDVVHEKTFAGSPILHSPDK